MLPPVSVPVVAVASPAAIAAPEPPLEPAGNAREIPRIARRPVVRVVRGRAVGVLVRGELP